MPNSKISISGQEFDQLSNDLFKLLHKETGHDFSKYKRSTLIRRLERRINFKKTGNLKSYLEVLKSDRKELLALNTEFLISVTSFFREPEFFALLSKQVIPEIIKQNQKEYIRIWVPACATGEEAYSIAILINEYLEKHSFRQKVKIFASDIDSWALEKARDGIYPPIIKQFVAEKLLHKYFTKVNQNYKIKINIREMIIFAEQNVLHHPPYSSIDLISCRNLLIYLNNEVQYQVLSIFHYALFPNGFLFLGNSENLGEAKYLYSAFDRKAKIFRKINNVQPNKQHWNFEHSKTQEKVMQQKPTSQHQLGELAQKTVLERFIPPSVIINSNDDILFFQGKTNKFLEQPTGEPTFNIIESAKEPIRLTLAHTIRNAKKLRKEVIKRHVRLPLGDTSEYINIIVVPIDVNESSEELYMVTFQNSHLISQNDELLIADFTGDQGKIKELEKELRETQEYLQSTIEELETTNEELKASNEEEQSVNEELQSANEELETSKEELQTVNEELASSNMQLHEKIEELTKVNNDMLNLLTSTEIATIFLDKNLHIFRFTPSIFNIMELIDSDIGRSIKQFSYKLDYPDLLNDLKNVLETSIPKEVEVRALNHHFFWMRIIPYMTITNKVEGLVITFTDITEKKKQEEELIQYKNHLEELVEKRSKELLSSIQSLNDEQKKAQQYLDIASVMIIMLKTDGTVTMANKKACEILEYTQNEIIGKNWFDSFVPTEEKAATLERLQNLLTHEIETGKYRENNVLTKSGEKRMIAWHNAFLKDKEGKISGFISSGQDITEQNKTRLALETSERDLKLAQNAGNIATWAYDFNTGMFHGSEIFQEIYGFDKPVVSRNDLLSTFPKNKRNELLKKLNRLSKKEPKFTVESEIRNKKTGVQQYILSSGELIFDDQGKPIKIIGTSQDISERIRSRQALKESEEKFRNIFDYSITGIAVADVTGNLLDVNLEFSNILGYSRQELLKMNIADFTYPDDLPLEINYINEILNAKRDSYRLEKRYINANKEIVWVDTAVTGRKDVNGKVELLMGTASDITQKKKAEFDLIKKNEYIQTILDNLPIGVSIHNVENGEILYLNKKIQEIYGWPKEELTDLNAFVKKVYPDPEYRKKTYGRIIQDIRSGDPDRLRWENIEISRPNGEKRIINAVNMFLPEHPNMISSVIDITELKKAEQELIKAKDEAEHANALKSAFLANTSHEIRTPLNGIIGFSELLEERSLNKEQIKTYIKIIRNSGDQLLKIIDDIIDISKIDSNQLSLHKEAFEFNKLIDDTLYFHKHSKLYIENPHVKLKTKKASKELLVKSDRVRIKQILDNLITNALKQTEKGSIEFGYQLEKDSQITIYVKDTGLGIDREKIEQIFERFVKLQSKSGTGIGLSIVKGLVELLNGKISIDSSVGEGSIFRITFPIEIHADVKKEESQDVMSNLQTIDLSDKKILVAEDDFNSYLLIEAFLNDTKANLIHVTSGNQIVRSVKKNKPDLILMDIDMPRMNGIQATKLIRKEGETMPIIAQTAYASEKEKQICLTAGCTDYISKPLEKKNLINKIAKALKL